MSAEQILSFIAPGLVADPQDIAAALQMAESYRPWCLPAHKQDEAQALYAAWLLTQRAQHQVTEVRSLGVTSESEGDISKSYGTDATALLDAAGFKMRYDMLARKCPIRMHRTVSMR